MIEKIFIPTVNRVNNQIFYSNLPDVLKKKVVFVVQAWERNKYTYPAEYLVLPDTEEFKYTSYLCIARTRNYVYHYAQHMKYVIADDDILFGRRNKKYFGLESNMLKSKKYSTEDDILEMFETFSSWLDEDITVCGCACVSNPPANKLYRDNGSLSSCLWIDGNKFCDILPSLNLEKVKCGEDVYFLLSLLSRGYKTRVSEEFIYFNTSAINKKVDSIIWDNQKEEDTYRDHKILETDFPGIFKILYDSNNNRIAGGYRNSGRVKIQWSKAYKQFIRGK